MVRQTVNSSNLVSVGYDEPSATLEVAFHSGGIYQYYQVPAAKYHGLMTAASHGEYFDAYIKKAGYRYRKVN